MYLTNFDSRDSYKKLKESVLKGFYNEEEDNKNHAKRSEIRIAIGNLEQNLLTLESSSKGSKKIYNVFSGFVHSEYRTIIELYSGSGNLYNMKGKNLLIKSTIDQFYYYIYRSLISLQFVSILLQKDDIVKEATLLTINFARKTDGKVLSPLEIEEMQKHYNNRFGSL